MGGWLIMIIYYFCDVNTNMWRVLVVFLCSIILLYWLHSLDQIGKSAIIESFRSRRRRRRSQSRRHSPRTEKNTRRTGDNKIEEFTAGNCNFDWLSAIPLETNDTTTELKRPEPLPISENLDKSPSDYLNDDVEFMNLENNKNIRHPIKIQNRNVIFENTTAFNDKVIFEDDTNPVRFTQGIRAHDDVKINTISMKNITVDDQKLQDFHHNIRKVNEMFTNNYLIDPTDKSIAKLLPMEDLIDKRLGCSSSIGKELSECKRKAELVKEMIEIVRDGKPADSQNGLCKKLNCPVVFKKSHEKHHCRAIILDVNNDKSRSIDLRADEDNNAEYYEGNKAQAKNVYYDDVDISQKNYDGNDGLNTVLLYKSNDDTKCELTLFRKGDWMRKYISNPDKPDLQFPCRHANDGKDIPGLMLQVYSHDKFTKDGKMEIIREDDMCQKGSMRKLKFIDAMHLRVLN